MLIDLDTPRHEVSDEAFVRHVRIHARLYDRASWGVWGRVPDWPDRQILDAAKGRNHRPRRMYQDQE